MTGGQEAEFHEIKIGGWMIWQSWDQHKFGFFMRLKFLIYLISWSRHLHEIKIQRSTTSKFWSHEQFVSYKYNHEIWFANNYLLAASAIMRSNLFKFVKLHLCLTFSHLSIKTFNLMIALATNKLFIRSKFANNAFLVLISWSIC